MTDAASFLQSANADFTIISITVPLHSHRKRQSSLLSPCVSEIINTLFLMADFMLLLQQSCRLGSNTKDAITAGGGQKMDE